jgi:sugar transferase (PEP-CTERM/EpsH1 system associated)
MNSCQSRKKPVHVLQVVHALAIGGTEQVVCDLTRDFNDQEFRTSVCCLDALGELGEELVRDGVRVHVLDRRPGLDISLLSRARRLYKQEKVDLIHAHQYTPYFYSATAALRAGSIPVIFTEHGRHWPDRVRIKRAMANQILRITTAAYTAVSEFSRQSLIHYEKVSPRNIKVIYNGISLNRHRPDLAGREQARKAARLDNDDLVILSIGRMDPIKDFVTLIRAFFRATQELNRIYLWIVGGGDGIYLRQLRRLVDELGIGCKVMFLGARRDVHALLNTCDLFALASITEAASMTILEAMAAGRAVVATDAGGNPELVSHQCTGLLVPVGNATAMGEALVRLLKDSATRERMGMAAQERVKERFTREMTFAQYRNVYRSAIAEKSSDYFGSAGAS